MTALATIPQRSMFDVSIVDAKINYAQQLATARLLPRDYQNNPGNLLLAVEYADSVGIHPLAAINGLHIMNGKPTASAGLVGSLVRRAGHKLRISVSPDGQSATATIIRADDPDFEFTVTWTMDMARQAGLLSNNTWKNFPQAMLKARAITQVARDACPEALSGIQYTPEELGAQVELDEDGEQVVVEQVYRQAPPQQPAPQAPAGWSVAGVKKGLLAVLLGADPYQATEEDFARVTDEHRKKAAELWTLAGLPGDNNATMPAENAQAFLAAMQTKLQAEAAQPTEDVVDAELVEDQPAAAPAESMFDEAPAQAAVPAADMTQPGF